MSGLQFLISHTDWMILAHAELPLSPKREKHNESERKKNRQKVVEKCKKRMIALVQGFSKASEYLKEGFPLRVGGTLAENTVTKLKLIIFSCVIVVFKLKVGFNATTFGVYNALSLW